MTEKRYALIRSSVDGSVARIEVPASCNVCAKDVSDDPARHHQGLCSVCQKETEHVIPFHGCLWMCRERHADDGKMCRHCGKALKPLSATAEIIMAGLGASRATICSECDPIGRIKFSVR
ncbi:MAG: hypothetical protein AAB375_02950 [Patescibacteria group bacterium]